MKRKLSYGDTCIKCRSTGMGSGTHLSRNMTTAMTIQTRTSRTTCTALEPVSPVPGSYPGSEEGGRVRGRGTVRWEGQ